jgi:hypothetical protein
MDLRVADCQAQLAATGDIPPLAATNRFWFRAAENSYVSDEEIILLQDCGVELCTEGLYSSGSGSDPLAEAFAAGFTAYYDQIAAQETIYREQENIFKLFAIANILYYRYENDGEVLDLDYFLNDYTVPETTVANFLPGRSAIREINYREDLPDGSILEVNCYLPTCGGVDVNTTVTADNFHPAADDTVAAVNRQLKAAGLTGAVYYDINTADHPGKRIYLAVPYDPDRLPELAEQVATQMDPDMALCYLDLSTFPDLTTKNAFIRDICTRQTIYGNATTLRPWNNSVPVAALNAFHNTPATQVQKSKVINTGTGEYPFTMNMIYTVNNQPLELNFLGKTRNVLEDMSSYFEEAVTGLINPTPAAIINNVLKNIDPADRDNLLIDWDELADTHTRRNL